MPPTRLTGFEGEWDREGHDFSVVPLAGSTVEERRFSAAPKVRGYERGFSPEEPAPRPVRATSWDASPSAGGPSLTFFAKGGIPRTITHATTDISPCRLRAGLTVISTSCPRAVRNSMRRSTEKVPERLHEGRDMWLLNAQDFSGIRLLQAPLLQEPVNL
jgi:hypothetical protein